jgi:hypothetical protein
LNTPTPEYNRHRRLSASRQARSETYTQFTPGLITDDAQVTDESTAEFLRTYMAELHEFIVHSAPAPIRIDLTVSGSANVGMTSF